MGPSMAWHWGQHFPSFSLHGHLPVLLLLLSAWEEMAAPCRDGAESFCSSQGAALHGPDIFRLKQPAHGLRSYRPACPTYPGKACRSCFESPPDLTVSRRCLGSSVITGDKAFPQGGQRGDDPETGVPGCFGSCKYPCAQRGGEGRHRREK